MKLAIGIAVAGAILVSCTAEVQVSESVQIGWDELNEMVEAFGYEQGIRRFCGDPTATGQDVFLAELEKTGGIDAELLARAKVRAAEVQAEFDQADPEEREYVCTVEMFVGSETRADAARQSWADIKGAGND